MLPQGAALAALIAWLGATALGIAFVWLARRDNLQSMPVMVA
jgi:hypothetical protein